MTNHFISPTCTRFLFSEKWVNENGQVFNSKNLYPKFRIRKPILSLGYAEGQEITEDLVLFSRLHVHIYILKLYHWYEVCNYCEDPDALSLSLAALPTVLAVQHLNRTYFLISLMSPKGVRRTFLVAFSNKVIWNAPAIPFKAGAALSTFSRLGRGSYTSHKKTEVHIKDDISLSKMVQKETEKENCHRLFKFKHSLNFASYLLGSTATLLTEYFSAMFPIFIHLY